MLNEEVVTHLTSPSLMLNCRLQYSRLLEFSIRVIPED